mmetsp:Transcript_17213/g.38098  ORF Transcript_17213/g.38098 Transcript_17213/m.38098 type:complete len:311 (-) Transcript_17213:300-1232(-)
MLGPDLLVVVVLLLLISLLVTILDLQIIEGDGNRKRINIGHTNVTDAERGANIGPVERGPERHTLVGVDVHAKVLIAKNLPELLLNAGDAHATPDQLDLIDVVNGKTGRFQRGTNGNGRPEEEVVTDLLKRRPVEMALVAGIVVEGIDEDGEVAVGAEDVLDLVGLDAELGHGAGVGSDVLDLAVGPPIVPLLVEVIGHVIDDAGVEGLSSESGIPRLGQNLEGTDGFALGGELRFLLLVRVVLDHRYLKCRGTHVVKHNILGLNVNTVNAKVKSGCGVFVNERQDVEIGKRGRIEQCLALVLSEEGRHG